MKPLTGGPDAYRYLTLGSGKPVSRPFHLRWLLPYFLTTSPRAWWSVFLASWPVAAFGFIAWRVAAGDPWQVALAGAVLLLGLPGILGPKAVIPVGVDMPSTALSLVGVWLIELGGAHAVAGVAVVAVAACVKESAPVWAALWSWSFWPLLALVAVVVRLISSKPGPDPLGARFEEIAAHPIRSALAAHRGQWRNAWVMVAPWGVCLLALTDVSPWLAVTLVVAYAQLVVATDSVRLYQHGAGPVMAAVAASVVPVAWLPLAVVAHVVWWRTPERV